MSFSCGLFTGDELHAELFGTNGQLSHDSLEVAFLPYREIGASRVCGMSRKERENCRISLIEACNHKERGEET